MLHSTYYNRITASAQENSRLESQSPQECKQTFQGKQKPQIISIPGIPLKEKYRYRVTLGHQVLGDKLSLEQAAELAGLKVKGVKS